MTFFHLSVSLIRTIVVFIAKMCSCLKGDSTVFSTPECPKSFYFALNDLPMQVCASVYKIVRIDL